MSGRGHFYRLRVKRFDYLLLPFVYFYSSIIVVLMLMCFIIHVAELSSEITLYTLLHFIFLYVLQTFHEMWAELLVVLVNGILDHPIIESVHSLNHCEDVPVRCDPQMTLELVRLSQTVKVYYCS